MVQKIRNIGPVSWRALKRAGLADVEAVRRAGAVGAYVAVLENQGQMSRNFLYALAAGLSGRHWGDVSDEEKGRLNREVEELRDHLSHTHLSHSGS